MVGANIAVLETLLDRDYALEHITGYVQAREEWFEAMRRAEFNYHDIRIDQPGLSVQVAGSTAVIAGAGIFDATINGMHAPWRLRFEVACARQGGAWRFMSARYRSQR